MTRASNRVPGVTAVSHSEELEKYQLVQYSVSMHGMNYYCDVAS